MCACSAYGVGGIDRDRARVLWSTNVRRVRSDPTVYQLSTPSADRGIDGRSLQKMSRSTLGEPAGIYVM